MKYFGLSVIALCFFAASCEQHDFTGKNGTEQLHHHGSHDSHGNDKAHH